MHLNEMGNKVDARKISRLLKEYFGINLRIADLNTTKVNRLLEAVRAKIANIKHSSVYHKAEKNPKFLGMLMIEQALTSLKNEKLTEAKKLAAKKLAAKKLARKNKPKKIKEGKYVVNETILRAKMLMMEGEVESAEAILAGQDLVDRFQKMLEDLSKMQNEELPPLGSTIRDNLSAEQSTAFVGAANEAISAALEAVRSARENLDVAVRTMAGEQVAAPAAEPGLDVDTEIDGDSMPDEGGDEFAGSPPAIGGEEPLGRSRRAETDEL